MINLPQFPYADKVYHFLGGFLLALVFFLCTGEEKFAFAAVALTAAAKEGYDYFHPESHTCDFWDFAATVLGPCALFATI